MLQCDAVSINESFENYYSKLYSAESCVNDAEIDSFFKGLNLPRVSPADRDALDAPLTQTEIKTAKMSSGKAPGNDGLGIEFYKHFK